MSAPEPTTTPPAGRLRRWKAAYDSRASLRWAVDMGLLALIFVGVGLWQTRAHVRGGALPAFELKTLSGGAVTSSSFTGKPALLAFWAPWCTVCETESRNLGWAQTLVGDRARVVSVATAWQTPEQVTAYAQRNGVDYPVLLDEVGLADQLNVTAFPTVYFVDERGHIKGSAVGYTTTLGLVLRTLW
ncbi:MAG: TlpA family protein disulfide reductase [Myxococcus sp.]|nr:TlpA family protein disulfide reductase [Myxococcus sp.]